MTVFDGHTWPSKTVLESSRPSWLVTVFDGHTWLSFTVKDGLRPFTVKDKSRVKSRFKKFQIYLCNPKQIKSPHRSLFVIWKFLHHFLKKTHSRNTHELWSLDRLWRSKTVNDAKVHHFWRILGQIFISVQWSEYWTNWDRRNVRHVALNQKIRN